MGMLWHDYLYTPLLNVLLFLYSGPAFGNLGVAVIELTALLRVALLPFTIVNESSRYRFEKLDKKVAAIERDFKSDHVKKKEKIRELLKTSKVNYWSKSLVLGVQVIVLVLLYQVFLGGIRFTSSEQLYSWVSVPSSVNTMFLGFDIAQKSVLWPGIVAVILFLEIYSDLRRREHLVKRPDVVYMVLFPIFSFIALALLPMVKCLFVLTSMFFTMFVTLLRKVFFHVEPAEE